MTILNARLDLGYDYGASGGPDDFGTLITRMGSGKEVVIQPRSKALREWELGNRNVSKDQLAILLAFWLAAGGRANRFYYKDWNDWQTTAQPLVSVGGSTTAFQLTKRYSAGGVNYDRDIVRPVTTILYSDGVAISGGAYSLSTTTGIATFTSAPSGVLTWTGEFDVLVRFSSTRFPSQFLACEDDRAAYGISGLTVAECLP